MAEPTYANRPDPYERDNSTPHEETEVAGEKRLVWKGKGGPRAKEALQQPKLDDNSYNKFNSTKVDRTEIVEAQLVDKDSALYPLDELMKFLGCSASQLVQFATKEGLLRRVKLRKGQSAEFKAKNCIIGEHALKSCIAHIREIQGSALLAKVGGKRRRKDGSI